MSHGHTRWAIAKTARNRNLLWTLPAVLFFLLGLVFLAIFAINYVDALIKGGHYLLLIISGNATPFLTLGIFSLILGGIFKICAYLASLSYIKMYEQGPRAEQYTAIETYEDEPAMQAQAAPPVENAYPEPPDGPDTTDL